MTTEVHQLRLPRQAITWIAELYDDRIVLDALPINLNKATAPFPEDVDSIRQWIDGIYDHYRDDPRPVITT
jgi:hypothetical protein